MAPTPTKFKETDIGLIPGEWGLDNIGNIASVTDFVANGSFASLKDHVKYSNEKDYAILIRLVDFNKNFNGDFVYVNEDGYNFLKKTKLSGGEIIISNVGEYSGTVFRVPELNYPMTLGPNSVMLKTRFSDDFYYFWLRSKFGQDSLQNIRSGSAVPKFNKTDLKKVIVPVPPIDEQKQIAEILSSLDDKIELNRKINANLENLASALFKKWFIDIGDELPEGWRIGTFGEAIVNFDSKRIPLSSREREKRQGSYPYYGATSIMDYVDDFIFDGTYVLLGEDGSVAKEDGKPFVQYVHGKMWVNNHAHVLQGKNGFSTEYIKVFLDQVDIMPFVTGAVQPKLNQANMNSVPMVIPDQKTLDKFNEILSAFFGMILENESQTKNLEQVRDSLLPRLMSGKIRV